MTDLIELPLNKLILWDGNVRKTGAADGLAELSASILAHGLLQPLVVRKAPRGKHAVVAGQRRWLALKALAGDGKIVGNYAVPCRVIDADADASEISLAENIVRAPMHPADQFDAFRKLVDDGASVVDVAARFGIPESIVTRRLKLGRLSTVILDAYRRNELNLETVQAFTVSDDQAAQERIFQPIDGRHVSPGAIRRALTEGENPATDKRVRYVGFASYEAAGGASRRDLFDTANEGYVLNVALLDRLVDEKLNRVADQLRAEGWKWVDTRVELDHEVLNAYHRRHPDRIELSAADEAERDALTAEYDELCEDAEDDPQTQARHTAIMSRLGELDAKSSVYQPEVLQIAGALVGLGYDGSVRIERGLIADEDLPPESDLAPKHKAATAKPTVFSAKLIEDLTARRSAAISAELADRANVALVTVVHALALQVFYERAAGRAGIQLHTEMTALRKAISNPDACKPLVALEAQFAHWSHVVPNDPSALWQWCLEQNTDMLHSLMAVCAAHMVDAVRRKSDSERPARLVHADALAEALGLQMSAWFTPSAENYFSRVSKTQIIADLCEAKSCQPAPAWAKYKKSELADRAAAMVAGTAWLPQPLRPIPPGEVDDDVADHHHDDDGIDDAGDNDITSDDDDDAGAPWDDAADDGERLAAE